MATYDELYRQAIVYEKNGRLPDAYNTHFNMMKNLGDMREYQKIAYRNRGVKPDLKSELKRIYYGCVQLVRLSSLLMTSVNNYIRAIGIQQFTEEYGETRYYGGKNANGTYNYERINNGQTYLAQLYTLTDAAGRAYKDGFYSHSVNEPDFGVPKHGPCGTAAEVKYFTAAHDLLSYRSKIGAWMARRIGLEFNDAASCIDYATGKFGGHRWIAHLSVLIGEEPKLKVWFDNLENCYNVMHANKQAVLDTWKSEVMRNMDPIKAEVRRVYGETEGKRLFEQVKNELSSKHRDYCDKNGNFVLVGHPR